MDRSSSAVLVDEGARAVLLSDFDAVFRRERTPMVRLAYLMVGSEAVAEEIVQDAFVKVLERWPRLLEPGAYLRRCVVNACLRHRTRRARALRLTPQPASPAAFDAEHTVDALQRLSPERRAVVVLRFYMDMTQDDIAKTLQIPVGTVKSTLHRALAELREAFRDA